MRSKISTAACLLLMTGCITTDVVPVASTDSPVRAEMVIKRVERHLCTTAWGGSCSFQESAIVLHTGPLTTREFGYGCLLTKDGVPDGQVLTNTADGIRIAFRCAKTQSWSVVYVGSENRSFLDCKKYEFAGEFRWDAVPTLQNTAARLAQDRCGVSFPDLADEVKTRYGQSALTDLLIATVAVPAPRNVSMDHLQAWDDLYTALPAAEKSRLVPAFRSAILGDSAVLALERAVRHMDLNEPEFLPALRARMERILNSAPHYETDAAAEIILRKIATVEPEEAARLACRELERERKRGALTFLSGALLAVANARVSCPVVLTVLSESSCDAAYYCASGRICKAEDLSEEVRVALSAPPGSKLDPNRRDRALLAAALNAQGSNEILRRWNERHEYKLDQPASPACDQLHYQGQKGIPCHCFDQMPFSACGNGQAEDACTFRVNDAERKVDLVVSR